MDQDISVEPVVEQVVEQQEEAVAQPQEQEAPQLSDREMNFKLLREKNDRIERERNVLAEQLKQYEARAAKSVKTQPEPEEDYGFAEDDLIEGKHLKTVKRELKSMQKKLKAQETQSNQIAIENRLKSQYSDFDAIVSKKNIDILRQSHPEIAATLANSSDLYSSAVSAYTFIKKLGIGSEDTYKKDREVAHNNAAKPRPSASVAPQKSDTPLSQANSFANGLTDELKAALLREMNEARKSL